MKKILLLLSIFLVQYSFAQNSVTLTGTVIDEETKDPLEFATLVLRSLDKPDVVTGGMTDMDGKFNVTVSPGNYDVSVEFISYRPFTLKNQSITSSKDLGTIPLSLDIAQLDEVEVVGERTTVELRLDKKIYNLGKDLTTQGASVSDALDNVPSVTVDVDGTIALRGNDNVRILINGKPSAMAGFGDTNIFQQLPADAIESVEVITSPSARYDAEGTAGILNIILKKDEILGFNGSVSLRTGIPENHNISANINYRKKKFNIFNTTGVYYRKSPGNAFYENRYLGDSVDVDHTLEDRDTDRRRRGINTNLGIEYYLTENSSITGSVFGRLGDDKSIVENITSRFLNDETVNETSRVETEGEKDTSIQFAVNYINNFNDKGHKLTADFQYSYDKEDRPTFIQENLFYPTEGLMAMEQIFQKEKQKEYLIQADYVLPMGDAQFEAGFRSKMENEVTDYALEQYNLNTGEYEPNLGLTNIFDYTENVHALYTQYGNKIGKVSFLLGLRLENTVLKGKVTGEDSAIDLPYEPNFDKNYLGLFPTVNLIYELGEEENLSVGYNRRINRPRGWFINPFPSRDSRTNISQGNPNLNPAFSNAFDVGYLKRWGKLTFSTSVYFQHETESFEFIQEDTGLTTEDGVAIIRSIPINLSSEDRFGGEFSIMYNPSRKVRLNTSFNVFKSQTDGEFNGIDYGAENTSWFSRLSANITLPAEIQWQTTGFYRGPSKTAISERKGMFGVNMAVSKDLIKDKATINLNVSDLFNSRKMRSYTFTDDFTSDSENQWRERQFTLSFTYRFNQPNKKEREKGRGGDNGDDDMGGFEG
ncbi:TonB-dependent receptor domain-containing protein [Sinomicrobium sp. M5D2P17]